MDQPRNAKGQFESESEERGEFGPVAERDIVHTTKHVSTLPEHHEAKKAAARMSTKEQPRNPKGQFEPF
jgi:hypothetical protein